MNDHTPSPRDEAEALLVFLANETLTGDERAAVQAAVDADAQLQGELAALRSIRTKMQTEEPMTSPGEFGLARLMRDIDRDVAQPAPAAKPRSNIWQIAAAVAVALFVGQTVMYTSMNDGQDGFELAGGETGVDGPTLTVAFAEGATEAAIRTLMLELDLTIVDGPSALGLYTLAAADEAAREAALTRLTSETTLIDSAEMGE